MRFRVHMHILLLYSVDKLITAFFTGTPGKNLSTRALIISWIKLTNDEKKSINILSTDYQRRQVDNFLSKTASPTSKIYLKSSHRPRPIEVNSGHANHPPTPNTETP